MDARAIEETRVWALPWAPAREVANPWVMDETLLNLAIWWVKMTRPNVGDFAAEVALVFSSFQRELR